MATTAELQLKLAEAEVAYHKLITGQQRVEVTYDGKSVRYEKSNINELKTYIANLKMLIKTDGRGGRSGAIRIHF